MADDVDTGHQDALANEREVRLEHASLEIRVREAHRFPIGRARPALQEGAGRVVPEARAVQRDLVHGSDDVIERVVRRPGERRRDAEVVLDPDAESEPSRVIKVTKYVIVPPHPGRPRVVVRDAVRPDGDAPGAALQRHRAVGAGRVDVMVETRHCCG